MNSNKIQVDNFMDFDSDAIITIGTRIADDNPSVKTYIDRMIKNKNAEFIYMHPIDDVSLQETYTQYIKYEAGSDEGVFALLASYLVQNIPAEYKDYFEDLDIGYLSGETSVGEEEFELLVEKLHNKEEITLIIGNDMHEHDKFENIAHFIRYIDLYTNNINVVLLGKENVIDLASKIEFEEVSDIQTYNGTVIYTSNNASDTLKGSASFATAAKIKDQDMIHIMYDSYSVKKQFVIDANIRGTIALYPHPVSNEIQENKILSGYRFKQVQIKKVDS